MTTTTEEPDIIDQLGEPETGRRRGQGRAAEPAAGDATDDIVTADQRIKKFRTKHKEGVIATSVEFDPDGKTWTARAEVWKEAPAAGERRRPDATATATRSRDDESTVGSLYPQESAETAAIGRALRFLGIEPPKTKTAS